MYIYNTFILLSISVCIQHMQSPAVGHQEGIPYIYIYTYVLLYICIYIYITHIYLFLCIHTNPLPSDIKK